jgi:Protein of unknown function (DUF4236)
MGLRFRRSVGNKFFRLNFSNSGFSMSTGCPGFHVNTPLTGQRRGRRLTMGLPGSGFSYSVQESTTRQPRPCRRRQQATQATPAETVAALAHDCANETLRQQQPRGMVEILPPAPLPRAAEAPVQQATVMDWFWTWLRIDIAYQLGGILAAIIGAVLFGWARHGRRR